MEETLHRTTIDTPLGPMIAVATARGLCGLEFMLPSRLALLSARLRRWYGREDPEIPANRESGRALAATERWLERYLAKDFRATVPLPPLDARGTAFELAVWEALPAIPVGQTDTYGGLARRLGRPKGARAVGSAVGQNPLGILVPCHRVVGSDGSLTGYGGGLERKRWLLSHEGHEKVDAAGQSRY